MLIGHIIANKRTTQHAANGRIFRLKYIQKIGIREKPDLIKIFTFS